MKKILLILITLSVLLFIGCTEVVECGQDQTKCENGQEIPCLGTKWDYANAVTCDAGFECVDEEDTECSPIGPGPIEVPTSLDPFINPNQLSAIAEFDFDHCGIFGCSGDYSGNGYSLFIDPRYNIGKSPRLNIMDSFATRSSILFESDTLVPYSLMDDQLQLYNDLFADKDEISISVWVKPTSDVGHRTIIRQWGMNSTLWQGTIFLGLGDNDDNKVLFGVSGLHSVNETTGEPIPGRYTIQTTDEVPLNDWTLITVTWNGANDEIRMYFNGREVSFSEMSTGLHPVSIYYKEDELVIPITVGARYHNPSGADNPYDLFFRGNIDDLTIFDYALDEYEVNTLVLNQDNLIAECTDCTIPSELPDNSIFAGQDEVSVSAWVTPTDSSGHRVILRQWFGNKHTLLLGLGEEGETNNKVVFGIEGDNGEKKVIKTKDSIPLNQETHIMATWNTHWKNEGPTPDQDQYIHIYINGVEVEIDYINQGSPDFLAVKRDQLIEGDNFLPVTIGGMLNESGDYYRIFQGDIHRVKVYDKEGFKEYAFSSTETDCDNGFDDDNDGYGDYADSDCSCGGNVVYQLYGIGIGSLEDPSKGKIAGCCAANDICYDSKMGCAAAGDVLGDMKCSYTHIDDPWYDPYEEYEAVWCMDLDNIENNGVGYCSDLNAGSIATGNIITGAVAVNPNELQICGETLKCPDTYVCINGQCVKQGTIKCYGTQEGFKFDTGGTWAVYDSNNDGTLDSVAVSGCAFDPFIFNPYCKNDVLLNQRMQCPGVMTGIANAQCVGITKRGQGWLHVAGAKVIKDVVDANKLSLKYPPLKYIPKCVYMECEDSDASAEKPQNVVGITKLLIDGKELDSLQDECKRGRIGKKDSVLEAHCYANFEGRGFGVPTADAIVCERFLRSACFERHCK